MSWAFKLVGGMLLIIGIIALLITSNGFGFAIENTSDKIAVVEVLIGLLLIIKG